MQPDLITEEMVKDAMEVVKSKKDPPLIDSIRFKSFDEGLTVQQMHIGSFDDEWKTVEPMHKWVEEEGYELNGKHHEIYLSDFRRTAPEKLKTILRHPIKKT